MTRYRNSRYLIWNFAAYLTISTVITSTKDCALAQITSDSIIEFESPVVASNTVIHSVPTNQFNDKAIQDVPNFFHNFQECGGSIVRKGSKFVVTGRGGLPPTPAEATRSDRALVDLGKPIQTEATPANVVPPRNQIPPQSTPIVEAQGWVLGSKGEVFLTASAPNVTLSTPWMKSHSCHQK